MAPNSRVFCRRLRPQGRNNKTTRAKELNRNQPNQSPSRKEVGGTIFPLARTGGRRARARRYESDRAERQQAVQPQDNTSYKGLRSPVVIKESEEASLLTHNGSGSSSTDSFGPINIAIATIAVDSTISTKDIASGRSKQCNKKSSTAAAPSSSISITTTVDSTIRTNTEKAKGGEWEKPGRGFCRLLSPTGRKIVMASTTTLGGRDRGGGGGGGGAPGGQRIVTPSGEGRGGAGGGGRVVDGRGGRGGGRGARGIGVRVDVGDGEGAHGDMEETCRRICRTLKDDCKVSGC